MEVEFDSPTVRPLFYTGGVILGWPWLRAVHKILECAVKTNVEK